jgi:hypothetical protein
MVAFDATGVETPTPVMLCRRYPPSLVPGHQGHSVEAAIAFPQVEADDWCGEYRRGGA